MLTACSKPPEEAATLETIQRELALGQLTPEKLTGYLDRGAPANDEVLQSLLALGGDKGPAMAKLVLEKGAIPSDETIAVANMQGAGDLALAMKKAREGASPEKLAAAGSEKQAKAVASAKSTYEGKIKVPWGTAIRQKNRKGFFTMGVLMLSTSSDGLKGARYSLDGGEWKDGPTKKETGQPISALSDGKSTIDALSAKGEHESLKVKLVYADGTESAERTFMVDTSQVK
ncbi:MAG: hypothetical protein VX938_01120, partial [Myxococcota bacterium]|nr:hypothetical protein [Myxococcota bacterium]